MPPPPPPPAPTALWSSHALSKPHQVWVLHAAPWNWPFQFLVEMLLGMFSGSRTLTCGHRPAFGKLELHLGRAGKGGGGRVGRGARQFGWAVEKKAVNREP